MLVRAVVAAAFVGISAPTFAGPENTHWLDYKEGDFRITDYKCANGQTLAQLKLHYRTLGTAERNAAGEITNGVLLLQGNTGTGANWLRPSLADELFKDGQPLDAGRYFIIMPDALGRGGSSKPSDGLKGGSNPPELDTVERAIKAIQDGRYVLIPYSNKTHRHFTHYYAAVWKPHLINFMGSLDSVAAAR